METVLDRDQAELADIAALEAERARIEAQIAAKMLAFEDRRRAESEWTSDQSLRRIEMSFAADELGAVLHQPAQAVLNRLGELRRVRGTLPLTWLAHLNGQIDGWRLRLISLAALKLVEPDSLVELDGKATTYASSHTATQTKAWLRRFVARVEPDQHQSRARDALSERRVWVEHQDDGMSWFHALLPTTDVARLDGSLTDQARQLPGDGRTLDQKRADLLADLLVGRSSEGPGRGGAVIGITVPLLTLAGVSDDPGISFDGQFALPAELVRELASEPGTLFHRVITDPRGQILDVTELGRFPSRKLRIAVNLRDGTCRVPTCSRPAVECDLDHDIPHPRGPTSGTNLQPLCRRHHRIKTHLSADVVALSMETRLNQIRFDAASWAIHHQLAA